MKKSVHTLLALLAFGATVLVAQAQPAPKILVIDMAKLYDSHYETEQQNAKLRSEELKANEELERLTKEGQALVAEYTELAEQTKNPTLTAEAQKNSEAAAQQKYQQIREKENEVAQFRANATRLLQTRIQTFRDVLLEKISSTATEIAKRRGATLLFDKAGLTHIGVSNIIYADPAYDITEEVLAEINKDRPAESATDAAGAPSSTAPAGSAPITVPGVTPKR